MRFITDRGLAELVGEHPDLELTADNAQGVLDDAARVYNRIRRDEQITEQALRKYGEENDLPPDRLNAALAVLEATGRLFTLKVETDLPGGDGLAEREG